MLKSITTSSLMALSPKFSKKEPESYFISNFVLSKEKVPETSNSDFDSFSIIGKEITP